MPAKQRLSIDADFPGGNIVVERVEGQVVYLHQDLRDTRGNWFWWHFRVRGAAGRTLTFRFTKGKVIGVRGPAVSLDEGRSWAWLGKCPDAGSFTYRFPADAHSVRFAFAMPYLQANLEEFLKRFAGNRAFRLERLCGTRKGRTAERIRLGRLDGRARHRVAITCRHHACESLASYALEGIIEAVLAEGPTSRWLRENVEFLIVPFVDKDGVEDGDQGKNRKPHDHNRDYGEEPIYPTVRAIKELLPRWGAGRLRVALDLHCPYIRGAHNEVIYLVGSAEPRIWAEQQRFGKILETVQTGPLRYRAADNLPFGKAWNTERNFAGGVSFSRWASGLPGIVLATTIEIPYANASGREVNPATARAFGRDLATALRHYLARLP